MTSFDETQHPRNVSTGTFTEKDHSAPEVSLAALDSKQELVAAVKAALDAAMSELEGLRDFQDINRILARIAPELGVELYAGGDVGSFRVEVRKRSLAGRKLMQGSFVSRDPRPASNKMFTCFGHWDNDRLVIDWVAEGDIDDGRPDYDENSFQTFSASASAASAKAAAAEVIVESQAR